MHNHPKTASSQPPKRPTPRKPTEKSTVDTMPSAGDVRGHQRLPRGVRAVLACSGLRPPGVHAAAATRAESTRPQPAATLPRGVQATPLSSWAIAWTAGGCVDSARSLTGRPGGWALRNLNLYSAVLRPRGRGSLRESREGAGHASAVHVATVGVHHESRIITASPLAHCYDGTAGCRPAAVAHTSVPSCQ